MLKTFTVFSFMVLSLLALLPNNSRAQSWKAAKYDTIWIPITSDQVKSQVRANAKDSVGLYQLSRRAFYQDKGLVFLKALKSLQKQQPKNAVLLAMECATIEESLLHGDASVTTRLSQAEYRAETRRNRLRVAKKLDPKLWLNYMTESNLLVWESDDATDPKVIRKQMLLTRRAIDLAPRVSFPYKQMASCFSILARRTGGSGAEAVRYYQKAEQLAPTNCAASLGLAFHYRYVKPNATGRQKAIQAVYATIPPGVKLIPPLRKVLLDAGIPVPPGH